MKRHPLRLTIALLTFLTGAGTVYLWLTNGSAPVAEIAQESSECIPQYDPGISPAGYGDLNKAEMSARFRELPLDKQPACVEESYRLTWIPAFHRPTVIRIWRAGDKYYIVTKRLDKIGGYGLGSYNGETLRTLTAEEWFGFVGLLNDEVFWRVPAEIEEPPINDATGWLFEGSNERKYHFISRTIPSEKLRDVFRSLFRLTGVETEYEKYL